VTVIREIETGIDKVSVKTHHVRNTRNVKEMVYADQTHADMVNIISELMIIPAAEDSKVNAFNAEQVKLVDLLLTAQEQSHEMKDGNVKTAAFQITSIEMEDVHHVTQDWDWYMMRMPEDVNVTIGPEDNVMEYANQTIALNSKELLKVETHVAEENLIHNKVDAFDAVLEKNLLLIADVVS